MPFYKESIEVTESLQEAQCALDLNEAVLASMVMIIKWSRHILLIS